MADKIVPSEMTVYEQFLVSQVNVLPPNQRLAELILTRPARAQGTALARDLLAKVSEANGLGTPRPPMLVVGMDSGRTGLLLMPYSGEADADCLTVGYNHFGFTLNLYKPFGSLHRRVLEGVREIYDLTATQGPVKIGNHVGRALYMKLSQPKQEPINEKPNTKKAALKMKRAAVHKQAPTITPTASENSAS